MVVPYLSSAATLRRAMRLPAIAAVVASASVLLAGGASAFGIDLENPPTPGVVGMPYKYVFIPKKGAPPYAFWLDAGELPPGLKIEADGTMQGTPTQPGFWEFTVGASQYNGNETQWGTSVTIRDRLNITTASLKGGVVGAAYSAPVSVVGNEGRGMAWTVSAGALPPGLALAASGTPADTTVSGTPTDARHVHVHPPRGRHRRLHAEPRRHEAVHAHRRRAALRSERCDALPTGIEGKPYSATPATASGGVAPFTWSVVNGALPAGVTLNPATGAVQRQAHRVRDLPVHARSPRRERPDRDGRRHDHDRQSARSHDDQASRRRPSTSRTRQRSARSAGRLREHSPSRAASSPRA